MRPGNQAAPTWFGLDGPFQGRGLWLRRQDVKLTEGIMFFASEDGCRHIRASMISRSGICFR